MTLIIVKLAILWRNKASHMNGAVERLIRSVKQALPIALQGQVLTQETLTTSLAIVESTLNNRPLSTPSDDPQDLLVLTPNSFLIQRASSMLKIKKSIVGKGIVNPLPSPTCFGIVGAVNTCRV